MLAAILQHVYVVATATGTKGHTRQSEKCQLPNPSMLIIAGSIVSPSNSSEYPTLNRKPYPLERRLLCGGESCQLLLTAPTLERGGKGQPSEARYCEVQRSEFRGE